MRKRLTVLVLVMAAALVMASGAALAVSKVGTDGPDVLKGTDGNDSLLGLGGQDDLFGKGGNDNLLGGPGKDNVLGGDERRAGGGDKNLDGGPGNDVIFNGRGSDNAVGGPGNDLLQEPSFRESSRDSYVGGDGTDVILSNNRPAARDVVACGDGLDRVLADRKDTVAGNCERVFFGLSDRKFFEEGPAKLPPRFAPEPLRLSDREQSFGAFPLSLRAPIHLSAWKGGSATFERRGLSALRA